MFGPGQKRRKPAAMIEMKMRNPYRVQSRPVQAFLCNTMDRRRRAIKQERAAVSFEPVARAASLWMRYRRAGTEYGQSHGSILSKVDLKQDEQDGQDKRAIPRILSILFESPCDKLDQ